MLQIYTGKPQPVSFLSLSVAPPNMQKNTTASCDAERKLSNTA